MSSGLSQYRSEPPARLPFPMPGRQALVPCQASLAERLDPAEFASLLHRLETPADCADLFLRFVMPFGFETFTSGEIDPQHAARSTWHLIHWPEHWASFRRSSGFADRDPALEALSHRVSPFTWGDLRADGAISRAGTNALNLAAAAGWREGLIVPIRQASGRIGLVSLAGNRVGLRGPERDYLTLISLYLHHHVRTLVGTHGFALPPAGLTPREIDALRLVVRGMSDAAIGRALGIAGSTAHEFIEKAKRKMNVRSRAELAALAVSLAIVTI